MNRLPTIPLLLALLAAAPTAQTRRPPSEPRVGADTPPLPPPAQRLTLAERSLARWFFVRDPWLALERGWRSTPEGLGRYDPDWNAFWSGVLEAFSTDLGSIRPNDLSAERSFDHRWLQAWLRSELILTHSQASSRWNPVFYEERARNALLAIRETPSLDADTRKTMTLAALREIPSLFQTAVRGLVSPSRELSSEAVVRLSDLAGYLNQLDPGSADEGWTPDERALFVDLRDEAVRAIADFRGWLSAGPVKTGSPTTTMGRRNWENVVSQLVGGEIDAHRLRGKLLRELARLDRALGRRRKLKPVGQQLLTEDALAARMETTSKLATSGFVLAGILDPKGLPPLGLEVHVRRGQSLPRELIRLSPGAERGTRLWVEPGGVAWAPSVARTRAALLSPPAQDVLAVRYGYPGEALLRAAASVHPSTAQRYLWNRATMEGWGLYAVDLVARLGAAVRNWSADDAHEIEATRGALIEVARVIAAIELHVEELPLEQVAASFADRTGTDLLTAQFEARRALRDPLLGIGYLTYRELRALERETAGGFAPPAQLRRLLETLLAHPCARVGDLRRLIAEEARKAAPAPTR